MAKRKPGRRAIYKDRKTLLLYLDPELLEQIEAWAEEDKISRNELLARAIEEYRNRRQARQKGGN